MTTNVDFHNDMGGMGSDAMKLIDVGLILTPKQVM
jgi:hypothetical protein